MNLDARPHVRKRCKLILTICMRESIMQSLSRGYIRATRLPELSLKDGVAVSALAGDARPCTLIVLYVCAHTQTQTHKHNRSGASEFVASVFGCEAVHRSRTWYSHSPHGSDNHSNMRHRSLPPVTRRTFAIQARTTHTFNSPAQRAEGCGWDALRSAQHTVTVGADV